MSGRSRQRVSTSGNVIEDIKSVASNLPDLVNQVVSRVIEAEIENEKHLEFETWFKTVVSNTGFNGDIDIFSNAFRKEFEIYMVQLNRVNRELSATGRRESPQKRVVQEQESESSTSNDDSPDEREEPTAIETGKRSLPPSTKKTPKYFVKRRKLDFVAPAVSSVSSTGNDSSRGGSSESDFDFYMPSSTSSDMGFSDAVILSGSSGASDNDSDFEVRSRVKVQAKGTRSSRRINPHADTSDEEEEETNNGKSRKRPKQQKSFELQSKRKSLRKKKTTKN